MLIKIIPFILLLCTITSFLPTRKILAGEEINPEHKYAWSENTGWINFRPATMEGVLIYPDHLEGYAWSSNIGWIQLGSSNGEEIHSYANTDNTNWGVNHDGVGHLSGYAWSETVGWINFNPSHSQVAINLKTGDFDGYAYSSNIGWIHFHNANHSYKVSYQLPNILPPTQLNATALSPTQINLSWVDNSTNETCFKIERDNVLIHATTDNITSYTDTSVVCDTIYHYGVKAVNTEHESTISTTDATTLACSSLTTDTDPSSEQTDQNTTEDDSASLSTDDTSARVYDMVEKIFTHDIHFEEGVSISKALFEGNVKNEGLVSNSVITPGVTLVGGRLSGTIINEGTITDIIFVGDKLRGGTLSGTILNESLVGGIIENVQLAPGTLLQEGKMGGIISNDPSSTIQNVQFTADTILIGGQLGGEISGFPDEPASIGAVTILPGTKISHLRLSPTVQLPENVEFGPGVILPIDTKHPKLEDFGIDSDQIKEWDGEFISRLEPAVFAFLDAEQVSQIPLEAFANISPLQLAELTKEALGGMTIAQFKSLPIDSLSGLTSQNMAGFSIEVIDKFTVADLEALDTEQFQQMPTEDVSKILTNLDPDKIQPIDVEYLLSPNWQLDNKTGELTAPPGKITLRAWKKDPSLTEVTTPILPNLNSGFGIGGRGTPIIKELTEVIDARTLEGISEEAFILSQDHSGILKIQSTEPSEGATYTFIPEPDNIIQLDQNEAISVGMSKDSGDFYIITTLASQQFRLMPAPKTPAALSEALENGEVVLGKSGDVLMEAPKQTRNHDIFLVGIFEPLIEPAPADLSCIQTDWGEMLCDFAHAPPYLQPGFLPNNFRQRQPASQKIRYMDGTAQTVQPTVIAPDVFIETSQKLEEIQKVVLNADGTFYASINGQPYHIIPNFKVDVKQISKKEKAEPRVILNQEQGYMTYSILVKTEKKIQCGKPVDTHSVYIFEPVIEPLPETLCLEEEWKELLCENTSSP